MPTFGLVIEGTYDEAALTELIRKCIAGNIVVVARPCSSSGSLISSFPGFLEVFRHTMQGTYVDKALVIRDADNKDPNELIQRMQSRIQGRSYPFPLEFVVIVQELETWLLADEEAISEVTLEYSGRTVSRVNEPLEEIAAPKERLKQILSDSEVDYTKEVVRKIAAAINLQRIEYRCPSFRSFFQAVRDC
jgi:hypothetical protein